MRSVKPIIPRSWKGMAGLRTAHLSVYLGIRPRKFRGVSQSEKSWETVDYTRAKNNFLKISESNWFCLYTDKQIISYFFIKLATFLLN